MPYLWRVSPRSMVCRIHWQPMSERPHQPQHYRKGEGVSTADGMRSWGQKEERIGGNGKGKGGNIRWHYIHWDLDPRGSSYALWSCRIRRKDTSILDNLIPIITSVHHPRPNPIRLIRGVKGKEGLTSPHRATAAEKSIIPRRHSCTSTILSSLSR